MASTIMSPLLKKELREIYGKNFDFNQLDNATLKFIMRMNSTYTKLYNEKTSLEETIQVHTEEIEKKKMIFEQYIGAVDASYLVSKTNKDGIITYVNDQFVEISGFSREELVGSPHSIVRHPKTDAKTFESLWKTLKSHKVWRGKIRNRTKQGEDYYVFSAIFPILDHRGEVLEYIAIRNNITKKVEAEKRLKKERKYSQMLFNNQKNIVFTGNKTGILEANRKFLEILGFESIKKFKEKHSCICEFFIEREGYVESTTPEKHWTKDIFAAPEEQHKVLIEDTEGVERTFSVNLTSIEFEDDELVIGSFTDITELEASRKQAEASEKAKSEFMANMSHEIRTPMNGIVGFTNLLAKSELSPRQKQFTQYIQGSTSILLQIVNDILDFSKIESGHLELELIETNPFIDLRNAMHVFKAQAAQKEISFIINIDSKVSECLMMDRLRVIQILTNLINNAIKFTPKNGTVELCIKAVSKDENYAKILFSVKDTGIGIPKDRQASIFQSFIQADNSTTRNFGGTGLGLSIGSSLCELMGSKLELESVEGKGSCFFFELDLEISETRATLANQVHYTPIYVLDHDEPIYDNVLKQLKHFKLDVITCSFEELFYNDVSEDNIIVSFNYKQYKGLSRISSKIILVDDSNEASKVADEENILYYINMYDEAPSILYNAILDYNVQGQKKPDEIKKETLSLKILVAEDYDLNRILIEELLHAYDLKPDFAFNGEEAVKALDKKEYDIVFMDINMPIMNGIDATKEIRKKGMDIPIVALTANALEGDRERYLNQGMDDYISKPIDSQELDALLQKYKHLGDGGVAPSNESENQAAQIPETSETKEDEEQLFDEEVLPLNSDEKPIPKEQVPEEQNELTDMIFVDSLERAKTSLQLSTPIMVRLLDSFLSNAVSNVESLLTAEETGDMRRLYEKAHALRGTSLSLKFATISSLCETVEYSALEEKQMDYRTPINTIAKEVYYLMDNKEAIIEKLPA